MDHGGEAARPTMVGSTVIHGSASTVQGSEANIGSGTFDGQLGAAAPPGSFSDFDLSAVGGRGVVPVAAELHQLRHEPGPGGVACPNIGASRRRPNPVHVALVGPLLPGGTVLVHDNYGCYSALQPRPGAGRGVVLGDLLPSGGGGAVYNGDYSLQPRPGVGRGEVSVDLLPDGAGHGEVFVGVLPGGVDAVYNDNYGYYALQPRPGAGGGHGQVLVDLLPDGAGRGEVFVGLLPGGGGTVHDDNGYYMWQSRPGAGHGEVLHDGVGALFDVSGNLARQTLPALGTGDADGIPGPNFGAVHDINRGAVAEHLRRLLPFAGIGACSVAVNWLAAGPGSGEPAVAFHLFVLLLGGLFLVILHVLHV